MNYKISGFNSQGEAKIVDDHGKIKGYGELVLEDCYFDPEMHDQYSLELRITWTPEYAEFLRSYESAWED